jgi:hypothetical protein
MKALLQQLLRVNNYNSRRKIKQSQSIKDMLKLMYRPNECYKNGCYQLGEAIEVFREDILGNIQKIQEILRTIG